MITELRKRQSGEISGSDSLAFCLRPKKISLSKLMQVTPALNNAIFLGFARNGKQVVAINDESVLLAPFIPFSVATPYQPPIVKLWDEENSPLLDKRVLVLVHCDSEIVATFMFCDSMDPDRSLLPDVRLKVYWGSHLIFSRLILARAEGHHIYQNYGGHDSTSNIIVVCGCSQLYFYLISDGTFDRIINGGIASTQSIGSSAYDEEKISIDTVVSEMFPCRSKWYWSSLATCVCADCLAFRSSPPTSTESQMDSIPYSLATTNSVEDRVLNTEVEIDCDLLALALLRKSFPKMSDIGSIPSHLIFTETRLLSPDIPQVTLLSSNTTSISPALVAAEAAFHVVLGVCIPYNGKILYIVWQLSVRPLMGQVHIRKVEDLVSFCKKVKIRGQPLAERKNFNSHADYLFSAVGHYSRYVCRSVDEIAIGMQCNDLCDEFKSPALDGTTASVLEIQHPVFPMAVFNDELFNEEG